MSDVLCPGCGEKVCLGGLAVGDRMDCLNCAGLSLRVEEKEGSLALVEIPRVSCPSCERVIEVPIGLATGDTLKCCDNAYVLTYEFGTFALRSDGKSGNR